MASIRSRYNKLVVDFRYMNKRCRETTNLIDTPSNRKKLEKVIEQMEAEITLGIFSYAKYFPKSDKADEMMALNDRKECINTNVPSFKQFATLWFSEKEIEWRDTYKRKIQEIIDMYLLPEFGTRPIHLIKKTDVLAFRSSLAKVTYGKANKHLSAARINSIMVPLGMILKEAAKRYKFDNPYDDIKSLKEPKTDIQPLTLKEVWKFINGVREDYRNYYLVRFLTGMRTSEIDGLTWENIDFNRREIVIKQALVKGKMVPPKTQESYRAIQMSPWVFDALKEQQAITYKRSDYVFCAHTGEPLDYNNVNKRVWHPTLKVLGLKKRNAYQTRHTAATLWLAAGESPEWIASQMGHSTTKMLFNTYSRYVPNMIRQDGSAFEALVNRSQIALLPTDKEASE
ncbi:site-specific integrase [Psychrobacter sp. DAB_AL62B]|uniref:site-specific integrase n=1 Tax=Psychrobacter sp. DAB_AL62B TaxID=1028420 RepID=UPI002381832A|nr:site-specific integrase [Psychrobacter sp. DAB_AL62B]MDE4454823.1 site-specific integrase [Psychrobacter sp. DAB_AL62B]